LDNPAVETSQGGTEEDDRLALRGCDEKHCFNHRRHAAHAAILGRGTIPKGVQFRDNEVWLMKWLLAVCEPE
jgi:hypothetical protein